MSAPRRGTRSKIGEGEVVLSPKFDLFPSPRLALTVKRTLHRLQRDDKKKGPATERAGHFARGLFEVFRSIGGWVSKELAMALDWQEG